MPNIGLVGRSSVLKVKSTPCPFDAASTKRTRSAPRTGAPKRKVLMDDTMVLHGEYVPVIYSNLISLDAISFYQVINCTNCNVLMSWPLNSLFSCFSSIYRLMTIATFYTMPIRYSI